MSADISEAFEDTLQEWKTNPRKIITQLELALETTGNLSGIIPLLFRYAAKPVDLSRHFPLEVFFFHNRPRRVLKRCGRQVGKSFQNAIELILRSILIPNWNTLYVTPLFEQVRRFSTQYVHALVEESPCKEMMALKGSSKQVLQRTFANHSTLYFTYAQRDANRARGINANEVYYDEVQMMAKDVFGVLRQVMGGSLFGEYESFAGTPLSFQNVIETYYNQSTMSAWMIKCRYCGYDNIAATEFDLREMIGPMSPDIGPNSPGLVCARCSKGAGRNRKPLFTEDGHWWHRRPEVRGEFLGVHLPQPIMPWHSTDRDRWLTLNNRMAYGDQNEVYNEILGEPCDSSFKPISERDLRRAACLNQPNDLKSAMANRRRYTRLAMGIDWGGGGMSNLSRTKAAIVGITPTGKTDVIFGIDLNFAHKPFEEVKILMVLALKFGVELIAHDAGGGVGSDKETFMMQTGDLRCDIWPISYVGGIVKSMMKINEPTHMRDTTTFTLDKAKSLTFLCQAIKQGHIRFFDYDYVDQNRPGMLSDFTALTSEVAHRVMSSDVLLVDREDGMSDDFAHAVNFACQALWLKYQNWPKLNLQLAAATIQELANVHNLAKQTEQWSLEEIDAMLQNLSMGA